MILSRCVLFISFLIFPVKLIFLVNQFLKTCDTTTSHFLLLRETPLEALEDFNHVNVSSFDKSLIIFWNIQRLWKFKSLIFFGFFFVVVLEFWILEELFGANCRFKNKFFRNQLTCSNHYIRVSFISSITFSQKKKKNGDRNYISSFLPIHIPM